MLFLDRAFRAECFEVGYAGESIGKEETSVYPRQPHPLNGFPKGVTPFGRRRHIRLFENFKKNLSSYGRS